MTDSKDALRAMENILNHIEVDIKRLKLTIHQLVSGEEVSIKVDTEKSLWSSDDDNPNIKIIEGFFDGYFMIGDDQKKYPVPMNYSSKTKLIPGDRLKLKIMEDGKLVYKLILPAERKNVKALLSITDDNKFIAITDDKQTYFLNQAAVTFFKGKPGDELIVIVNAADDSGFGALEAIIQK